MCKNYVTHIVPVRGNEGLRRNWSAASRADDTSWWGELVDLGGGGSRRSWRLLEGGIGVSVGSEARVVAVLVHLERAERFAHGCAVTLVTGPPEVRHGVVVADMRLQGGLMRQLAAAEHARPGPRGEHRAVCRSRRRRRNRRCRRRRRGR